MGKNVLYSAFHVFLAKKGKVRRADKLLLQAAKVLTLLDSIDPKTQSTMGMVLSICIAPTSRGQLGCNAHPNSCQNL